MYVVLYFVYLTFNNECNILCYILELFKKWKTESRRSIFLQVPISQSYLISIASKYGFLYHHARKHHAVLSLWLVENTKSKLPPFANHTLGAAGDASVNPKLHCCSSFCILSFLISFEVQVQTSACCFARKKQFNLQIKGGGGVGGGEEGRGSGWISPRILSVGS